MCYLWCKVKVPHKGMAIAKIAREGFAPHPFVDKEPIAG